MMKVWGIVKVFGVIAAVFGPLPFDITECHKQMTIKNAELDKMFSSGQFDGDERLRVDGRKVGRKDVVLACVESPVSPELGKRK